MYFRSVVLSGFGISTFAAKMAARNGCPKNLNYPPTGILNSVILHTKLIRSYWLSLTPQTLWAPLATAVIPLLYEPIMVKLGKLSMYNDVYAIDVNEGDLVLVI